MSGHAGNQPQDPAAREEALRALDTRHAHSARVYDYWLGGKDHFTADREAAEQAIAANPGIVMDVRANRAFLARVVRYLVYLDADLRDTKAILDAAPEALDFSQPIALMLLIVLHMIPDGDDPYGIVTSLTRALPSGSYLVLAHPASDIRTAQQAEMTRRVNERMSGPKATMRDRAAISRFFDGLDLLDPGVVQPQQWRPEPGMAAPGQVTAWCGVARKEPSPWT